MLFADFTHPSTIVALAIEAALFGLACAAAFLGVAVRPVRWLARGLAAMTLVLGLAFAVGMVLELSSSSLPFVLPGAPLGTYAQMTQLGLLVGVAQFGLTALGAALVFRRPPLGGLLLVIAGLYGLLDEARMGLQDPRLPLPNLIFGVLLVLLVLAVGTLVLATWWAERTAAPRTREDAVERYLTAFAAAAWVLVLVLVSWLDQYRLAPAEGLVLVLGVVAVVLAAVVTPFAVGACVAWRRRAHAHRVLAGAAIAMLAEWAWLAVGVLTGLVFDPQRITSYFSIKMNVIGGVVVLLVWGVAAAVMGAVGAAVTALVQRRLRRESRAAALGSDVASAQSSSS